MKNYLTILILLSSTAANAVSFDCNKATTEIEKRICNSPELSLLDDQMSSSYKSAFALSAGKDTDLRTSQRAWFFTLKQCAGIASELDSCVSKSYRSRLDALKTYIEGYHPVNQVSTQPVDQRQNQEVTSTPSPANPPDVTKTQETNPVNNNISQDSATNDTNLYYPDESVRNPQPEPPPPVQTNNQEEIVKEGTSFTEILSLILAAVITVLGLLLPWRRKPSSIIKGNNIKNSNLPLDEKSSESKSQKTTKNRF